ncbi:DUF1963 domain-containing protein [Streptomyces camelliae]|uniref:DUF1963 domain-containing protein n=1 Tax=Streptomyces camelliae TaxID=3004093 RepID=A0ABY7NU44_9ACTN|nr:DUF1963 domain-containing protein [Streptomyces sp. HUAS 2-6]WBO61764.1 DUF1963 domain-containing protein [Streptomyces sp. HUAS 2-6]
MLEPGTAWPEIDGVPLSPHAVLDTDALAPGLAAELPTRPGLLNFFHLVPDVPYERYRLLDLSGPEACRVIPAAATRAVKRAAPEPARSYPVRPLRATEVTMLPDCWDIEDADVDFDPDETGVRHRSSSPRWATSTGTPPSGIAPSAGPTPLTGRVTRRDSDGPAVHLLQLAQDAELGWGRGDAGTLYFSDPGEGLHGRPLQQGGGERALLLTPKAPRRLS